MRILFIHDHPFFVRDGLVFSDKLPYSTWQRYLRAFDHLTVFGRRNSAPPTPSCPLSSGDGVDFIFGDSLSNFNSLITAHHHARLVLSDVIKKCDGVIARVPSEYGLLACAVARELGKPYLIEVVGCSWDALWHYGGARSKVYAPLLTYRMRSAIKKAPYVCYVSREFLQSRYPAKRAVMTAAISNVQIPEGSDVTLVSRIQKINASERRIQLGLIGSFKTRYKGVHVAIAALGKLKIKYPYLELRVLGGGDVQQYQALAQQHQVLKSVHFDGLLPTGEQVYKWLDDIDIYVQPSFQEGVPRALIEAMSRGCPAVASSAGGIPELLDGSYVFKPGDVEGMAQILSELIDDVDARVAQAERNFEVAKGYEISILTQRRDDLLKEFKSSMLAPGDA